MAAGSSAAGSYRHSSSRGLSLLPHACCACPAARPSRPQANSEAAHQAHLGRLALAAVRHRAAVLDAQPIAVERLLAVASRAPAHGLLARPRPLHIEEMRIVVEVLLCRRRQAAKFLRASCSKVWRCSYGCAWGRRRWREAAETRNPYPHHGTHKGIDRQHSTPRTIAAQQVPGNSNRGCWAVVAAGLGRRSLLRRAALPASTMASISILWQSTCTGL